MQRDEFRRIVADAVNQSLQDKSSTVTAPPQAQLDPLIDAIADGIFAGLVATLDEQTPDYFAPAATPASPSTTVEWPLPATPAAPATETSRAASSSKRAADLLNSVPPASSNNEVLLWRGRPYMTIGRIYELTTQRLRIIHGVVSNQIDEIELVRVRDTRVSQNVGERMFDIGDVTVLSGDVTTPETVLYNVKDPVMVRELIRKAVYEERERRRMLYREDIHDDHYDVQPGADLG